MTSAIRAGDIQTGTMDDIGKEIKNQTAREDGKKKMPRLRPLVYTPTEPSMEQEVEIIGEVHRDQKAVKRKAETQEAKIKNREQAAEETIMKLKEDKKRLKIKLKKADIEVARSIYREVGLKLEKQILREESERLAGENSYFRKLLREKRAAEDFEDSSSDRKY